MLCTCAEFMQATKARRTAPRMRESSVSGTRKTSNPPENVAKLEDQLPGMPYRKNDIFQISPDQWTMPTNSKHPPFPESMIGAILPSLAAGQLCYPGNVGLGGTAITFWDR